MNTPPSDQLWLWTLRHGNNLVDPDYGTHGIWQRESSIYPQGVDEVIRVRDRHLADHHFHILMHSPLRRAEETAKVAVPDGNWTVCDGLAPCLLDELDNWVKANWPMKLEKIEQAEEGMPGYIATETNHVEATLRGILLQMRGGQSALVVGHMPLLGLVRHQFEPSFAQFNQTLPKAGIYRYRFQCGKDPTLSGTDRVLLGVDEMLPPKAE